MTPKEKEEVLSINKYLTKITYKYWHKVAYFDLFKLCDRLMCLHVLTMDEAYNRFYDKFEPLRDV